MRMALIPIVSVSILLGEPPCGRRFLTTVDCI